MHALIENFTFKFKKPKLRFNTAIMGKTPTAQMNWDWKMEVLQYLAKMQVSELPWNKKGETTKATSTLADTLRSSSAIFNPANYNTLTFDIPSASTIAAFITEVNKHTLPAAKAYERSAKRSAQALNYNRLPYRFLEDTEGNILELDSVSNFVYHSCLFILCRF
jgi:hypothetical protein